MATKKLINQPEGEATLAQLFGFILIFIGVVLIITGGLFDLGSSLIAISFFTIMLGVAFAFPKLLEGNSGLSTMRIVVFMMINTICILLLKIGWEKDSLSNIGLDEWWMGVIAFVFGAKATQAYFESKLAVPAKAIAKSGMATVEFTNAEIAKLAVEQNREFLKIKFPNIVSISDAVLDLAKPDSHVITIYLKDNNSNGIPDRLEVKMPDGGTKQIATEVITSVGKGQIHINQTDEIKNGKSFGSICCIVETIDEQKKAVTAGHVFSKGDSVSFGGELSDSEQSPATINDKLVGKWFFQLINHKNDLALTSIDNWQDDPKLISFRGKKHYEVRDEDIGKTRITAVSKVFNPNVREAFILDHNTSWEVDYNDKTTVKDNIILIGSSPDRVQSQTVSRKGDSGGCVYEPDSGDLVGLILGGNDKFTWVMPLKEVFENFSYNLS